MTIEKKGNPLVKLEELNTGTVFEHDGEIYMKTANIRERTSVVELEFGCLEEMEKDTLVQPLNARLTITY